MTGQAAPPAPDGPSPVSPTIPRGAVAVKCLATLAAHQPDNAGAFPLSENIRRVADLLAALDLPAAKVATILLNGAPADLDSPLSPGDAVTLLPTLSGG
jgi:sulfur carrier protein ThiS